MAGGSLRREVLASLAGRIAGIERAHPVRVAIDGVDAAGKTTLADELVAPLAARGRPVIRAGVDSFHRPRAERYRRGRRSPEGCFRDSFDHELLRSALLEPLGPVGSRRFRTAVFDHRADRPVAVAPLTAAPDAVLLCDGVFLLRPELRGHFDFAIFLEVEQACALERMLQRAARGGEDAGAVRSLALARHLPAHALYLRECDPQSRADVVVENGDPERPRLREPSDPGRR